MIKVRASWGKWGRGGWNTCFLVPYIKKNWKLSLVPPKICIYQVPLFTEILFHVPFIPPKKFLNVPHNFTIVPRSDRFELSEMTFFSSSTIIENSPKVRKLSKIDVLLFLNITQQLNISTQRLVRLLPTIKISGCNWRFSAVKSSRGKAGKQTIHVNYYSSWTTNKKSEARFNGETIPLLSVGVWGTIEKRRNGFKAEEDIVNRRRTL